MKDVSHIFELTSIKKPKMKSYLILLFALLSFSCFGQSKLRIIHANSNQAEIFTEDGLKKNWGIDRKTKLDVFSTGKLTKAKFIKFKTDIDSISFRIQPGGKVDFIVLLNGKDSCYTRIQSPELINFNRLKPELHDSISLTINDKNTIFVKAILNEIDTLNLNFDTGTTELILTEEVLKNKILSRPSLYNTYYDLKVGHRIYKNKIYDAKLTGDGTDGRFGWDLFDGLIVELNYDKNLMIVHSKMPKYIIKDKAFTKLDIRFYSDLLLVNGVITQSNVKNKDWFLFDTGYQRTTMLDDDLLKAGRFPVEKMEVIKKTIMKGAKGNEVPVITSNLDLLKIGSYELKNVPAQILTSNKPLKGVNIHILGNEVLKRFNTILDFQNNVVYLKPNHLFDAEYIEQKKAGS